MERTLFKQRREAGEELRPSTTLLKRQAEDSDTMSVRSSPTVMAKATTRKRTTIILDRNESKASNLESLRLLPYNDRTNGEDDQAKEDEKSSAVHSETARFAANELQLHMDRMAVRRAQVLECESAKKCPLRHPEW